MRTHGATATRQIPVLKIGSSNLPGFKFLFSRAFFSFCQTKSQFDASRRGKKMLDSSRDKNEGLYRSGEGGVGPAM